MGTFHQGKGEWHGITVVVETHGSVVYVGRCDTVAPQGVVLLDADRHDAAERPESGEAVSKEAYLKRAAAWGIFKKFDHLVVPHEEVASIRALGSYAK